ncbi:3'-5' exonuclease [Streptosporangium sp. NPDC048047]|uniref:3'-5' exonuclease n=1 Tax=Streptosporangium sp. NPDC048047 TaxID=3155748 RepID=UPI00342073EA
MPQQPAVLRYGAGGLPVYRAGMAPPQLATRRQLRADGLSTAGLAPAAWLHYSAHHGICPLYERAAARPVRPLTPRQREALAAGRALVGTAPCYHCRVRRGVVNDQSRALCDECGPIVRAAERIRAAAEAEAHERMLVDDRAAATAWAREVLADPATVILDTETTGLYGSYAVSVAVVTTTGAVLLDTLLNPQVPIPAEATAIHGITDAAAAAAPTFGAILPQLTEAVHGRRVVVYNEAFDVGVLTRELKRHFGAADAERAEQLAAAWLGSARWECAMERYACWYGDWSNYRGDYTWQPLRGDHDALGDCRAVLRRLWAMAGEDAGVLAGHRWPGPKAMGADRPDPVRWPATASDRHGISQSPGTP